LLPILAKRGGSMKKAGYGRLRSDTGQHGRILITGLLLGILAFVPIGVRLWNLMIRDYGYYSRLALANQSRTTPVDGRRGEIYDSNMNVLATSVTVQTVYLDPHELKQSGADIEHISQTLGQLLNLDPAWIQTQAQDLTRRYKRIAAQVEAPVADAIRSYINETETVGIHLEPGSKRVYPYGTLASQVLGFTNVSGVGSEGVEAAYNSFLQGSGASVITTKGSNEMDMPFSYEAYLQDREGCSVVLTLDVTVQACLEKQLQAAIDRYNVQNGAFGLVMNAKTGQILAMATLGGYDPNAYLEVYDPQARESLTQLENHFLSLPEGTAEYSKGKQTYLEELNAARLKQWRNRVISDGYEPGSTFKVLTMAAALDCGAIDLNTSFHCSGAERIPGRSQLLHCWRSTGHGSEQTPQALQNSCNIAFAHIALKLGGERFYEYVEKFGILEKTGIDLSGESKGVFFSKPLVTQTEKWGTASLTSGSFGQTFKLTPLQLVRAIASVVNGGWLMEPYLVEEVLDAQGNTVLRQEPTAIRQVISRETSQTMCGLLRSVVTEGTAKNAAVAGFDIGGKTGTSEKIDVLDANGNPTLDKIVSFVGVAPMDDPEYIVLVALDTPSRTTGMYISGGVMAAPTVGAVMADILPYLGVRRSYSPEEAAGQQVVLPEFTGMTLKEAKKAVADTKITFVCQGQEELVTAQLPEPGSTVSGDSQVLLYFGETPGAETVAVPDFMGMNRAQAAQAAGELGLNILVTGNQDVTPTVTVTSQSVPKDSQVPPGTAITLQFTDTKVLE